MAKPTAGYSGKSLIAKLGLKEGAKAIVVASPAAGAFDFIHAFVKDEASLIRKLQKLEPRLAEGGMLWISWPKKSSKLFVDVTEDDIRVHALPMGLVDVKVCAVDEDWSGLKLMRRKKK
jgi:hypothetical protein